MARVARHLFREIEVTEQQLIEHYNDIDRSADQTAGTIINAHFAAIVFTMMQAREGDRKLVAADLAEAAARMVYIALTAPELEPKTEQLNG